MTNRLATDESQNVVWRWEGEAFGNTPAEEIAGVQVNLRFLGQYFDVETNLHYNMMRYYDPSLGRYITSDPIGLGTSGTRLNHLYSYSANNPITSIDPTGLAPTCKELIRIPIGFDRDVTENLGEWGKWKYAFTITLGGEVANPFLAVNCVCKRSKDGTRRTVYKIKWFIEEKCTDCGGDYTTSCKEWETVSDSTRDIKDSDQIIVPGGYRGNQTSAEFLCKDKCKNLN